MRIREASDNDIPEILQVLKASLGETSSKKTEDVWRFKHIENPFGKSLVLVAEYDNAIVGVRAFMKWQWRLGESKFSAFRAVDTATHPDHQGKGIFKKLTLAALDVAKENGDDFVFNTPNSQSKPGYLKMGWKEVAKIRLSIKPAALFKHRSKEDSLDYNVCSNCSDDQLEYLLKQYNLSLEKKQVIFTPKTRLYLKWRYEKNNLQKYNVFYNNDLYLAGYLKNRGKLTEFRVSECIYISETGKKKAKEIIKNWSNIVKANFISYNLPFNHLFWFSLKGNYGPHLTFKEIQLKPALEPFFLNLINWEYSLGDMELF